jgi:hypothetical protein
MQNKSVTNSNSLRKVVKIGTLCKCLRKRKRFKKINNLLLKVHKQKTL